MNNNGVYIRTAAMSNPLAAAITPGKTQDTAADFCIAGEIGVDDEFYHYVKEVSNVLIIQTDGRIYNVFDLMKYF